MTANSEYFPEAGERVVVNIADIDYTQELPKLGETLPLALGGGAGGGQHCRHGLHPGAAQARSDSPFKLMWRNMLK